MTTTTPTTALADLDKPEIEQEWAKVDPATAFHLIERHAEDWADAGRMMEAWRKANSSDLAPSPQIAEVAELPTIDTPEFRALADDWASASWRGWARGEIQEKWNAVVAHIAASRHAAEGAGQAGQVALVPDQQQIEWSNDLQGRLIDLSQDMTESEDARQVMAEAACLLAALTGHAVSQ